MSGTNVDIETVRGPRPLTSLACPSLAIGRSAASSRARASAHPSPRRTSSSRCAACSTAIARSVVPFGARDAATQFGGVFAGGLQQRGRADEGLLGHEPRLARVEALADGGLGELLDEQEEVGRPRPRDRRQRVDLRLRAPRRRCRTVSNRRRTTARSRGRCARARGEAGHGPRRRPPGCWASTEAPRLRPEDRLERRDGDARRRGSPRSVPGRRRGAISRSRSGTIAGLTPISTTSADAAARAFAPGSSSSAMLVTPRSARERRGLRRRCGWSTVMPPLDVDVRRDEAGEDRAAHRAGAEDRDRRAERWMRQRRACRQSYERDPISRTARPAPRPSARHRPTCSRSRSPSCQTPGHGSI